MNDQLLQTDEGLKEAYIELYGTSGPTIGQRTEYFKNLWDEFGSDNKLETPLSMTRLNIYYIRVSVGMSNAVRKGNTLRFRNREDMLIVKLKYGLE